MHSTRKMTNDITWIGGNDRRLNLFENIFPIPYGISYNSYLLKDEKTVLLDTADAAISRQFFENLEYELAGKTLDYIIVNHMEPDHCALLSELILRYPTIKIIGNNKTFTMIEEFFSFSIEDKKIVVKEGDTLSFGKHTLQFIMAPMVHWPEVMMTYDMQDKVLFSADAFGTFGALQGNLFDDEIEISSVLGEARRYYTNIVGKYGNMVQTVLKKASALDVKMIAPLHGYIWRKNLFYILEKYDLWSKYQAEDNGVLIVYSSVYGNTASAVDSLANELAKQEIKPIEVFDCSCTDISYLISSAFQHKNIVLASTTYNGEVYPKMRAFLQDIKSLNIQNKNFALIENGTWAPLTKNLMGEVITSLKNCFILENCITIHSSLKENQYAEILQLAKTLKECTK